MLADMGPTMLLGRLCGPPPDFAALPERRFLPMRVDDYGRELQGLSRRSPSPKKCVPIGRKTVGRVARPFHSGREQLGRINCRFGGDALQ